MLEEILTFKTNNQPTKLILFTIFITVIGFISSILIFPEHSSIAHVLITTILLIPLLSKQIKKEEKRESKVGMKRFYKNHKSVFKIFLLLFTGIFIGYVIIILLMVFFPAQLATSFDYQFAFIENSEILTNSLLESSTNISQITLGLIMQNLLLIIICFALSLFYGSGGIFLVILNASIFATFLIESMKLFKDFGSYSLVFGIYLLFWFIPITAAFLLTAIAGGVMSKALVHEKFHSKRFNNVLKDAFVLFISSLVLIIIAGLLQVFLTRLVVGVI